MSETSEETIASRDYEIWIRIGESDYEFIRSGNTNVFDLADGFEYSITIDINGANEFVWTLTDSTITESGAMQEYPENPCPIPARVNISNENSFTIRVHAGIWANDHNSRVTLFTSPYMLSGSKSNNWEIASGTYNVWIQKNSLLYPLLDGADAEEFFFESDTDYRIVIGDDNWVCTNLEDSSETSGSLSATGFALEPPKVYESFMYPSDGRVDVWTTIKLVWRYSSNTDSCDLYFDTTDGSTLLAQDLIEDEFQVPLAYSTTYYWKVVAKNTSGEYTTNVISFTTEPPLIPELSSIDSGETNQPEIRIDIEFNVNIDEDTLTAAAFTIPLRPGNNYEASYEIVTIPERSSLIICYQDSDWPSDHCVCVISSINGSTVIAPVMAGGNSDDGRFMDYEAGRLAIGARGQSTGEMNVYAVGANSLTQIVPYTHTDTFISFFDMDPSGTRIATNCTDTDIIPDDFNKMYYIYDLEISGGELIYKGSWSTGAYCKYPLFSHDGQYIYIMSRDNDTLMVWNADGTDYSKVRDISFPFNSDYCRYCLSPDGSVIVGFSYNNYYDENYRFYIFDNIR